VANDADHDVDNSADRDADSEVDTDDVRPPADARPRGRVVTVFSPKGGAGTTTVATNLAVLLAGGGRSRVCVVDLDLEFGDVSIMTGLSPARSLADAANVPGTDLADEVVDRLLTPWQDGVDCVLAPVDPSAAELIAPLFVAQLLAELRMRYEFVVVDTPSQLSEHVLEALDAADHQVLLTTPQLPALKSLRLVIDTLQLLGYEPTRRTILLNQVGGARGLDRDAVQEAINHPVAAVLPHSDDVAAAIDAGVPLAVQRRDHAVVQALVTFTTGAIIGEFATRRRQRSRAGWSTAVRPARVWRHLR
jgi:pilus assembly protein CpaE